MIPVEIEVVYLGDTINHRIVKRTFRVSVEWEFYGVFDCIDKIYALQGFKNLSEKFDTITVLCNNPYYEIEVRPDCRYECILHETIETLTDTIKQYCTNVITKCVKISCARCHCNYNILFDKVRDIDASSLPSGWARIKYKTLCKECSEDFDRVFFEFMEGKNETS